MTGRSILLCGLDPVADRWTIGLWHATAELHLCLYVSREEGAFDAAGRWRRQHVRHCLLGRAADQARAMAMALHFCSLIRATARAHAATPHARRSFELACSERLARRLRAASAAARDAAPDAWASERSENEAALRAEGLAPSAAPPPDGSFDRDRAATRHGKAAADNISLVLRSAPAVAVRAPRARAQMQLPF